MENENNEFLEWLRNYNFDLYQKYQNRKNNRLIFNDTMALIACKLLFKDEIKNKPNTPEKKLDNLAKELKDL